MVLQSELIPVSDSDPRVKFESSDHGDTVLAGLTKLRDMEQLFDVVLIVEGQRLPAHRVVLASCSDYFRAMFTDDLLESQLDEIRLNGVTALGMKKLIDFAYSSKIVIDTESVEDVLNAANHIQLLPVVDACVNYLKSNICLANCVDIASLAELFTLDDLRTFAYQFMSTNFQSLSVCSEFMKLSSDQLQCLLQSNLPIDCSECDVLMAVIGWCSYHHGFSVSQLLPFLSHINVHNISAAELEAMHNYSDLVQMCSDEVYGQDVELFIRKIMCSNTLKVPGLVNVRGYEKSVVVAGGFEPGRGMSNDVRFFSKDAGQLKVLTSVPHVEQCNFGVAVVNNKLYVIGGCYNDEQMVEIIHGYGFSYSPQTGKWKGIQPMLYERCRFYLGAVKDKLFAIGGDPSASSDPGENALCECFDPDSNSWSEVAELPGNRMQHAGIVLGTDIYISGGLQNADGPTFNTFFKYDTLTDTWEQLPCMLSSRADHSMFIHDDKIYVVGGWFDENGQRVMEKNIDCYDPRLGRWETVESVPSARLYATYTVLDSKLYVIGGWLNGDYQHKCTSIQVYDIENRKWEEDYENVCKVWEHCSCTLYLPICKE